MATRATTAAQTATGIGQVVPLCEHDVGSGPTTVLLNMTGAVGTVSVEVTLDNVRDPSITPVWVPATGGSALTTTTLITIAYPVCAVRPNVTAYTSGNITLKVLQGDVD